MAPPAWDEGIDTGVDSIDTEHRLQVSLVNALDQLVGHGVDAALVAQTIAQLVDFTNVHFLSEELMMRLYAYPQHDVHKIEHTRLAEQVEEIRRRVEASEREAAIAAIASLKEWLVAHIRSMDQAFALWCARNGIRAR